MFGHSTALIADAIESLADTVGSLIVWQGLRYAQKPADEDHPYGHGKAEALTTVAVGLLLIGAAAYIIVESFHQLLTPHQSPDAWTLVVLVAVVIVKELLFRMIRSSAALERSDAARADAWHHRADAVTSALAFIGVSIAIWGPAILGFAGLVLADEVAALLASGIILFTAYSLMHPAWHELIDAAPHPLIEEIRRTAAEVEGVRLVEKVHARKSGRGYLVDMHLHVDPDLSVREAHALAGMVKAHIRTMMPAVSNALIHIEPSDPPH